MKKITIQVFSSDEIPPKYANEIMSSKFCVRNGTAYVSDEWISFQLSRAPIIIVALVNSRIQAFLIAFDYLRNDDAKDPNQWHLDIICRNKAPEYKGTVPLLMEKFIVLAKKSGAKTIVLHATSPYSEKAYQKYGFKTTGYKSEGFDMVLTLSNERFPESDHHISF